MDEEILYDDYEVYHNHRSKHYQDYKEAVQFAKVSTQYEDVNLTAYIIRKNKIRGQEKTCYIESVTWIEDGVWVIRDLM